MSYLYGDTQAFLAVPREHEESVLDQGYICKKRAQVPIWLPDNMDGSVKAMRTHHANVTDTVVFEVHGVPEENIDRKTGKIQSARLSPKHIRRGTFKNDESAVRFISTPCPLCNKMIPELASERGHVGLARFRKNAFAVTPCTDPQCEQMQELRQASLDEGEELTLYHQTSPSDAKKIKECGGKMCRGSGGAAGAGIYLARSVRETEWKTEHHGVVLECKVRVGRVKHVKQADKKQIDVTFAKLIQENFDSVLIDRGTCPNGAHKGQPSGDEYVVYSWDQVKVLREVPRDKCPCAECQAKRDKK